MAPDMADAHATARARDAGCATHFTVHADGWITNNMTGERFQPRTRTHAIDPDTGEFTPIQEPDMTAKDRHDELVAPIDHRAEAERLLSEAGGNVSMMTTIGFNTTANTHALLAMLDLLDERLPKPRKVDPELVARNLDAIKHEIETPMREHGECCEPTPADDLPGEPVEPGDLRAGDRVAFTWRGERITGTLVSASHGDILRSDALSSEGYYPNVVYRGGKWDFGISDVRLIERAPREDEDPDEALARVLSSAGLRRSDWDDYGDILRERWRDVARAAREHIEAEGETDDR